MLLIPLFLLSLVLKRTFWEEAPSMDQDKETAREIGDGPASVRNVLLRSGACSVNLWGRDLGFVGGNVQEAERGACGFPQTCNG